MTNLLKTLDWEKINSDLLENGFTITKPFLTETQIQNLITLFDEDNLYRSTVDMKRYNFGKGTYRYFKYPLPDLIQHLRESFYEKIVPTANMSAERLKSDVRYPSQFHEFAKIMQKNNQTKPTPLILKYSAGDFNCLHQDIANDLIFPYQMVIGLTEKNTDYEGGDFILTQVRPRMQTVPHILKIPKGAGVIFTSNYHPQLGKRGYYRTVFKHGVGKIESGSRYTLGVVFHDYREKS